MLKNNEENPRYIELIDTTLRDGAQAPHVSFSYSDKKAIISALFNAGIQIFEAGIPAMGSEERNDLMKLKNFFLNALLLAGAGQMKRILIMLCHVVATVSIFPSRSLQYIWT